MAVGTTTDFKSTADELIQDAYLQLNVFGLNESIPDENTNISLRILNRMFKSMQQFSEHLWVKQTVTMFPQKDQSEYTFGSDNITSDDYLNSTLDGDYAAGVGTIVINDAISASADDYIGVVLDDNSFYWDQINTIISKTITFKNGTLPSAASDGNIIYTYTNKLENPWNVYKLNRFESGTNEIPMNKLSNRGYFELPNKSSTSRPVSYEYDRQRDNAIIRLWPTPAQVDFLIKILIGRRIKDIDLTVNNIDFPQEWEEAIVLNLAVRLARIHQKNGGPKFAELRMSAEEALELALDFDNESTSLFFAPDYTGEGDYDTGVKHYA